MAYAGRVDEAPGFAAWYRSIVGDDADRDEQTEASLRRWFLDFYRGNGAVSRDVAEAAFSSAEVQLAAANVAIVLRDIERTTALRPTVEADDHMGGVRVSFNGNYTAPSVWAWENPDALVEVAAYLQEHVMESVGLWPTCPAHHQVLLPDVEEGQASWRCQSGEHVVAPVGQLGNDNDH